MMATKQDTSSSTMVDCLGTCLLAMTGVYEYADLKVKNRTSVGSLTQDGKELHLRQNHLALMIAAPPACNHLCHSISNWNKYCARACFKPSNIKVGIASNLLEIGSDKHCRNHWHEAAMDIYCGTALISALVFH